MGTKEEKGGVRGVGEGNKVRFRGGVFKKVWGKGEIEAFKWEAMDKEGSSIH